MCVFGVSPKTPTFHNNKPLRSWSTLFSLFICICQKIPHPSLKTTNKNSWVHVSLEFEKSQHLRYPNLVGQTIWVPTIVKMRVRTQLYRLFLSMVLSRNKETKELSPSFALSFILWLVSGSASERPSSCFCYAPQTILIWLKIYGEKHMTLALNKRSVSRHFWHSNKLRNNSSGGSMFAIQDDIASSDNVF